MKRHFLHTVFVTLLLAALIGFGALSPRPIYAAGTVAACDEASLATALSGGGSVTFACDGTIILSATITIASDTTLDASGHTVSISGNNAVRVFTVNPGVTFTLQNLTIVNGKDTSGAGGGLFNDGGTVNVINSTFAGNVASGPAGAAGSFGDGGAGGNGGAGRGGGLFNNAGTVSVTNSTFAGNRADGGNGGIGGTGGTSGQGGAGGQGGNGLGGAVYNNAGALTLANSTFSSNRAAGGNGGNGGQGGPGSCGFTGCNPPPGPGGNGGNGGNGAGGGVYNVGAITLNGINSTFFDNRAFGGGRGQGGPNGFGGCGCGFYGFNGSSSGGSIVGGSGPATLTNTIVANGAGGNCAGAITDGGNNLQFPDTTCGAAIPSTNPQLGPLQNNGGPTQTYALLPGSPAIDAGNNAVCAAPPINNLDQRSVTRLSGAACDIGAFEREQPAASLNPASLSFDSQLVGTTSAAQAVTLSNSGNALLTINDISTSGDYAQTNDCGSSLAAGASCTINVTFTPTASGSRSGTLTISDDALGSPHTVALSGTGTVAIANLSPASLSFGNQLVGTTSAAQAVTLANSGSAPLTISGIATSGDFAQANICGTSLAAGASCTINVTFTPTATGNRTGTLTINDNAAGSPHTVTLSGIGTVPIANLSPASLSFGNQLVGTTSAAQPVTLSNSGSAALTISGISASGDFAQTNDCGSSLAAGASCAINITFTPTATGSRSGTLTINDNAAGSPHTIALNGSGVLSADLALSLGADQNPVRSGTNLTYLITVKNAGPTVASGVVVSEPLPAGTTFVSATPSQGSCITPAPGAIGTMTCNLGGMANGATATVTLVVRVTAAGGTTLSNTASVSATSPDPNSTNNAATLTTRVFGTKH